MQLADHVLVVHDEHPALQAPGFRIGRQPCLRPDRPRWRRLRASDCSSTRKVAPRPGAVSTQTWPPYSCTMPCTVASPMPLPLPTSLVVKNGSNMRSMTSAAIPGPLSRDRELDERAVDALAARGAYLAGSSIQPQRDADRAGAAHARRAR